MILLGSPIITSNSAYYAETSDYVATENVNLLNKQVKDIRNSSTQPVAYKPKPALTGEARVTALEQYLQKRGSYLAKHASLIVQLSDQYGVDYRLVVAISGVESGYCKVNFKPYNCWGFGRYSWVSEEDGIRSYFALMNKGYFTKGKRTPETIATPYNPWPDKWAAKVYVHYAQMP